jgi:DNA-binding transcriptional MerR regulator
LETVDQVTIAEILQLAKEAGISINQRTFRLYADMGLIPRPDVRNRDEGGRSGYYDPRVLGILSVIPDLQEQGYSLRDIKAFLGRLENIASQMGKDPITVQVSGLTAISGRGASESTTSGQTRQPGLSTEARSLAIWRALSGPVVAEMIRRGMFPDTGQIDELTVRVSICDEEPFTVPVFIDPSSFTYENPARGDDAELAVIASAYQFELTGKKASADAETTRCACGQNTRTGRPAISAHVHLHTSSVAAVNATKPCLCSVFRNHIFCTPFFHFVFLRVYKLFFYSCF